MSSKINEEMKAYVSDVLMHYGIKRRSGRYPYGSGDDPYQHEDSFLSRYREYKDQGMSEKDIAKEMDISTTQLRVLKSLATSERRMMLSERAQALREKGYSLNEIADMMGYANDSSVRSLLNATSKDRMLKAKNTADFIKEQIDKKGMIDIGSGVEAELGISKEKLRVALEILKMQGYEVYGGRIPQVTNPGQYTTLKVVCPPGTQHKEIFELENVHSLNDYRSKDGGETFKPVFQYPESMDSSRLKIRYAEDGGVLKDGVIEIRRGVKDLDLGESHYAQVRILVDGNKYLKGMAVYSDNPDDFPDGVDIVFNTNKKSSVPKMEVLKDITNNPDNPFGALIKEDGGQSTYIDSDGKEKLSLINKTRVEGDWGDWADRLPAQFLSKQNMSLINKQIDLSISDRQSELDDIMNLTNPTVKKLLLNKYAETLDSQADHLYAAALPRQKYQVILPLTSISDDEVYAPNYENGEKVALVRFPHGGTFEIPIVTVNNKIEEGQRVIGKNGSVDAVGISKAVADRLSGADFDGDTVMVIPTNSKVKISNKNPLKELEGFDTKLDYGPSETKVDEKGKEHYYRNGIEYKTMSKDYTQKQMGSISNLITDMTIKGASDSEIARAVKHSMVVIDAAKHHLDYKQSEIDQGIDQLRSKWLEHGPSTLISRANAEASIPKTQGSGKINPETGKLEFKTADDLYYTTKTGVTKMRTQKTTQMRTVEDAHKLSSGTQKEEAYANYANALKNMAASARKGILNAGKIEYSSSANATYKKEVEELDAALELAKKNRGKERQAQRLANIEIKAIEEQNEGLPKKEKKKIAQQAITKARNLVGASRRDVEINITDRQWEAIQSGAIHENKLSEILKNTNLDRIRELATPKQTTALGSAKQNMIRSLSGSGYTNSEIAKRLGISASAVQYYLKEAK